MSQLCWLNNSLAEEFNNERDRISNDLLELIKLKTNKDVYDLEIGNWVTTSLRYEDGDVERECNVDVTSSKDAEGIVTLSLSNCELFEGKLSTVYNEAQSDTFNDMMKLGQIWDVVTLIVNEPAPCLTYEYNPFDLPKTPINKL